MRLYVAVLNEFPDYMTPTLVAHSMLGAHLQFSFKDSQGVSEYPEYYNWMGNSFRKCVLRVNQKEFDKISALPNCYLGHENNTLEGRKSCAIPLPYERQEDIPNVLKYAKLWKPSNVSVEKELAAWKEHFDDGDIMWDGEDLVWVN
mgnify:CR=1 FL=1